MDVWKYLEVLRKPNKSWLFSKDITKEKINALAKIAEDGYPSLISYLTDFLKSNNKELRDATCQTIIHLFNQISHKKAYYNILKHCSFSKSDIDFYESIFSRELYIELLAISSLNESGYIREKAIKKLTQVESPRAIPFLIYRLADWVIDVREFAIEGIKNYLNVAYIDDLIENLPLFEWLQKVERTDLSGIYHEIVEFIVATNRNYILTNFKKYPDKIRLLLAKHLATSIQLHPKGLELFLTDTHSLVRKLVIEHFDKLEQTDIEQLLLDKSSNIRLQTLYCLKSSNNFDEIVTFFLADASATIRNFSRFTLKHTAIDVAYIYSQNLIEEKQIVGSLSGLAEIEAKQYAAMVKQYLPSPKIKIKKTAFVALCKLDEEGAYQFALSNIATPYIGLRQAVIAYLSNTPKPAVLEKARTIYQEGNYDLKKSMLHLFHRVGGWVTIPDLMLATIDDDEKIRHLSFGYLQIWKMKIPRLFTTPKQEEIEKAKQVFNFVFEAHERKQYFETNPVEGIDFYFT